MPFMTWDNTWSVNVKKIDAQHQKLFDLINTLYDAMKEGRAKDILSKVLADLVDYTVFHFETEEKLFREHGYPEYTQHRKAHEELTKQVREIKGRFDRGETTVSIELLNFLNNWLSNHIYETDRRYSSFLNEHGVC